MLSLVKKKVYDTYGLLAHDVSDDGLFGDAFPLVQTLDGLFHEFYERSVSRFRRSRAFAFRPASWFLFFGRLRRPRGSTALLDDDWS